MFQVTQFVEANSYRRSVLARHYSQIPCHDDIKTFSCKPGQFFVVAGGSPCTDISAANPYGKGIDGENSGLWWEQLRIICECRPQFVVWENVARARYPRNGQLQSALGTVLRSLATNGYDAEWITLTAAALGAPHRRERIFVIAYTNGTFQGKDNLPQPWWRQIRTEIEAFRNYPSRSCKPSRTEGIHDGAASWLDGYHRAGWWAKQDFPKQVSVSQRSLTNRTDRVAALGDACVPQQAAVVWRRVGYLVRFFEF